MVNTQGVWTITDIRDSVPPTTLPPIWAVSVTTRLSYSTTEYELWIGGPSGAFNIVSCDDGTIVYQGSHSGASAGEIFAIPLSALTYGPAYKVVGGAGQPHLDSRMFRVEHRWPRENAGPNILPGKLGVMWDYPAVGTDTIAWDLHWVGSAPQPSAPIILTMVIGGWNYGFTPTLPVGDTEVMWNVFGTLGTATASWDGSRVLDFGWTFSVDDPVFVGAQVAMQAAGVLPNGDLVVSDVAGVILQ